uniref:No apical meristem-associated C-terminal domain-containing protein n=1 Tax=Brassica oleracea var. oleracea TaxID=109376 RepID=A0A0D3CCU8_BRAOL
MANLANPSGFSNLLRSQIPVDLDSPEPFWFGSQVPDESPSQVPEESGVKERRKYSPREDKILIGAWLNTSKDPVVGNEQKAGAFWKRIVEYYNASPHLVGQIPREITSCKQRNGRPPMWLRMVERKSGGKEKRRQVLGVDREEEDVGEPEARPIGVKAAKAGSKKKKSGREEELSKLHGVLELKEKLSRHKVLDRLLAKKEPLSEMETSLKLKLMSEML